jgi:hypothetical protein
MNDVTGILSAMERGDPQSAEKRLPLVYNELRTLAAQRLAEEKPGQTLQGSLQRTRCRRARMKTLKP